MAKKSNQTKGMLQSRVKELESIIDTIALTSKQLECENIRLRRLLYKSLHVGINADDIDQYDFSYILSEEAAKELSLSIECLQLPTRIQNGLLRLGITTIADLLREFRDYKMERVKQVRMLGKKSVVEILEAMRRNGYVDRYNKCYLFKYV